MDLREKFEDAILDASGRINDSTEWRDTYYCEPCVMSDLLDRLESVVIEHVQSQMRGAEMAIKHWSTYCDTEVTCLKCCCRHLCEFAWDPYNTDGDCLAEK